MTFKYEVCSNPAVRFSLSLAAVDALIQVSGHHYDGVCEAASKTGGFLQEWRANVVRHEEYGMDWFPIEAKFRQLDTCLKIIEMARHEHDDELFKLCSEVNFRFHKMCNEINNAVSTVEKEML